MSATCPVCDAPQSEGLLCHADTTRLERDLGDVASIVADLNVTLSRQAKIGASGKSGKGWAREKLPIHLGAIEAADVLANTLTTWARDVSDESWQYVPGARPPAVSAACNLLVNVNIVRRHPAVVELVDEITDAIKHARHVIDRPADRKFFGTCYAVQPDDEGRDVTCLEEIWASPSASEVTCKVCGITHEIEERRRWLMSQAEDLLCSVQEAARVIGSYGERQITESTIRNYVSKGQLIYHGKVDGSSVIRMGDLMQVIAAHAAKPRGRKLRPAS